MTVMTAGRNPAGSPMEPGSEAQELNLHAGPVARMLSRMSQWFSDYAEYKAEYKMENCKGRHIAL